MLEQIKELGENIHGLVEKQTLKDKDIDTLKKNFVELTLAVDRVKAEQGRIHSPVSYEPQTLESNIARAFAEDHNQIKMLNPNQQHLIKTMTTSGNLTGAVYQTGLQKEPIRPYFLRHISDVVPYVQSSTGVVQYPIEKVPLSTGSFSQPGEGNTKALIDYNLNTTTLQLKFLAGMSRVSKELLADLPWLQTFLSRSLTEDFRNQQDRTYLPLLIAASVSGVTSESISAAKAIDYVMQLVSTGRNASAILAAPNAYAAILKTKPNDYGVPFGYQITPSGTNISLLNLPVVPCPFMTGTNVLVGDFENNAAIVQSEGLTLQTSTEDGTNFAQNLVSFRLESRENLAVFTQYGFIYGAI